ncbi:sulfite reductase flavoprotein subunit alpha [Mycobacterium sp. NPDC006124]|uniref:diflavin oxidoreductase n=1 Tax=Mycobacterium sp. NPDC006124 TaxID=3156729 RepID=UPI0033AF8993
MTSCRDSLIVAYGTDMGNAEDAAMTFAEAATVLGVQATAVELNQVKLAELRSATQFVVVTSTFGDGEFPDGAALFWEALSADDAPRLDHLSFAVLALGDVSYEFFCNAGKLLDARLEALGAIRLLDRVDVDGPYERAAAAWTADLVKVLEANRTMPARPGTPEPTVTRERHRTVDAPVTVNRLLTAPDSSREVRHFEVDVSESEFDYRTGDSVAIHAPNDPRLVEAILDHFGVGHGHVVADHDEPLGVLLSEHFEIRTPSRALETMVAAGADDMDVLDLIRLSDLTLDEALDTLRPLQSRDYSVASSPLVHPDHVHLTVATVRYTVRDRQHSGVASTFLADRGHTVRVRLRPNQAFRLPAADVPIIMVGPGTGIAPFRAFLQERRATGATGRSWLFFGDRHRATDFLYGDEMTEFAASGTLTRLDLAFSRDRPTTEPRTHVQRRMSENAADLFSWLQDGAHLYVCGDEKRMAKDVDATLRRIVEAEGALDPESARAYVDDLVRTHRYVRDVY